jgi:hypothetical protein
VDVLQIPPIPLPKYCLPILVSMASMFFMKTTLDIQDTLIERAKRHAKRVHLPLRAIVEEGLRRVLSERSAPHAYKLPDASVGDPRAADPLEALSWQDLREEIYGEPSSR